MWSPLNSLMSTFQTLQWYVTVPSTGSHASLGYSIVDFLCYFAIVLNNTKIKELQGVQIND